MLHTKNYQNRLMFHGIIQKMCMYVCVYVSEPEAGADVETAVDEVVEPEDEHLSAVVCRHLS